MRRLRKSKFLRCIIYVMATYKLSKEWIVENGEMIKEGYSSAMARGYDIGSVKDVLEVIRIVDPENATEENARIFSEILKLAAHELKEGIKRRYELGQKPKQKIVN